MRLRVLLLSSMERCGCSHRFGMDVDILDHATGKIAVKGGIPPTSFYLGFNNGDFARTLDCLKRAAGWQKSYYLTPSPLCSLLVAFSTRSLGHQFYHACFQQ